MNKPICQKCSKTLDEWDETFLCPACTPSAATCRCWNRGEHGHSPTCYLWRRAAELLNGWPISWLVKP